MSTLIQHAYDCSIKRYIDFDFLDRKNALTIEGEPTEAEISAAWEQICMEFSDLSNEYLDIETFYKLRIYRAKQHISNLANGIAIQYACLEVTGEPLFEGFEFFKRNTHRLIWNNDVEDFKKQLKRVEARATIWKAHLKKFIYEYEQYKAEKGEEQQTRQQRFTAFIELLNTLKTSGFVMDKEKDSMMDVAVVIKSLSKKAKIDYLNNE